MSLFDKAKIHVQNVAATKNVMWMVYDAVVMVNRHLPNALLNKFVIKKQISTVGSEKHLMPFLFSRGNGGCFVDVGANIGLWTFYVAKQGSKVHAFEPSPRAFNILEKQAKKFSNVKVYPYALGNENTTADLKLHYASGHNSLALTAVDFTGATTQVQVKTLDSFNLNNVGLIKIDTEGYELPILEGATQTILRNKPRLIIEVHKPYTEQKKKILELLKRWSYKWIIRYKSKIWREGETPQPHIIAELKKSLLERSREYWKFPPLSIGIKMSTDELNKKSNAYVKCLIERDIAARNKTQGAMVYREKVSCWIKKEGVKNMLDFGCGLGVDGVFYAKHLGVKITFADIVKSNVDLVRRYSKIWDAPTSAIHIDSDSSTFKFSSIYDMVYANGVLHHISNAKEVVKNLSRFLKPNGLFICMLYTPKHFKLRHTRTMQEYAKRSENPAPVENPYSDYYDYQKTRELFNDFHLIDKWTTCNGMFGWYVWRKC